MTTDPQTTAWLDQEDAHLAALIRRARFAVQYVGPGDLSTEPAFGYTIGLFGLGHPELVVVGRGSSATHALLDAVAGEVVAAARWSPASCSRWAARSWSPRSARTPGRSCSAPTGGTGGRWSTPSGRCS